MLSHEAIVSFFADYSSYRLLVFFLLLAAVNAYIFWRVLRYLRPVPQNRWQPRHEAAELAIRMGGAQAPRSHGYTVADDSPDALLAVDAQDRIVETNARVHDLLGYQPAELVGIPYQNLLVLRDGDSMDAAWPIRSGSRILGIEHFAEGLRKDGSRFRARVNVCVSKQAGIQALICIRDISHEAAPGAMSAMPRSKTAANLAADACSTWDAELKRMREYAHVLEAASGLSPAELGMVRQLRHSAEGLCAQLERLQRLSLPDPEAAIERQPAPLALAPWLAEKSRAWSRRAAARRIDFEPTFAYEPSCLVIVHRDRLESVCDALIDYLVYVHPCRGIRFQSSQQAAPGAARLPADMQIEGGEPLEPRDWSLLFIARPDPAAAGDSTSDAATDVTTDADAALQAEIMANPLIRCALADAAALGAELSIESNGNSGLLFHLSLCAGFRGLSTTDEMRLPPPNSATPRGKVLSIAFDADLRSWLRENLQAEGFTVEELPPAEAVHRVREGGEFNLIICETDLNAEPDFDLTYEIRQFPQAANTPVLLVRRASGGDHAEPLPFHNAQRIIEFPASGAALKRELGELLG